VELGKAFKPLAGKLRGEQEGKCVGKLNPYRDTWLHDERIEARVHDNFVTPPASRRVLSDVNCTLIKR